jgi:hypothetical protein
MRVRYLVALAAALWLSGATTVVAAGICFQADNNNLAVVKKYSPPSKGSCKNFAGWEGFLGNSDTLYGTACLNSAGDRLNVGYTIAAFSTPYAVWMTLPYPSLTGGSATMRHGEGLGSLTGAFAGVCPQLFSPVP